LRLKSKREAGVPRGACAWLALIAVLAVFAWSAARVHFVNGGNWTALFCVGVDFPMPPDLAPGTYLAPGTGYDGQFYRLLAHDPFLRRNYARYVDAPQLRFRRALVPFAAWLLAFGRERWVDGAYIAVEMVFLALGTYWCARLMARRSLSPAWGLLFVVLPGTLASFDRMLLDGPLCALFAGFLLACEEERWGRVWVLAALAALTRETGTLLAAAMVLDGCRRLDWRRTARFAACLLPATAWYWLLFTHLPPNRPVGELGIPVWGLIQRLFVFRPYPDPFGQLLLRATDLLALVGLGASIVLAIVWLRKRPVGPETIAIGLFVALALVLASPGYLYDPFSYGRPASPLLLWVMLEAAGRRAWIALAAPLAISSNVGLVFAWPAVEIAKSLMGH
jgi:hypothetical protein